MALSTIVVLLQDMLDVPENLLFVLVQMIGAPTTVMLLSVLFAVYTMGVARKIPMKQLMESAETSIRAIGMMLLILGAGGALKEVLIEGGVGDHVALIFEGSSISPLLLAWLIAAVLRVAQGSATVAALTTAGLVIPLMDGTGVNLELMVLATGAGSIIASQDRKSVV